MNRRLMPHEEAELWRRFKSDGCQKARERLIEAYTYIAAHTACRTRMADNPLLETRDLVGLGVIGLVKAVDQFDHTRGIKFTTFAINLVRGAILEGMRAGDWVPRSIREKAKISALTNIDEATFIRQVSLEQRLRGADADGDTLIFLIDDGSTPVADQVTAKQRSREISAAVDRLSEREKLVVALYYHQDLTFAEIAAIMLFSESRAYQLHQQAIKRLRSYLQFVSHAS